jgi:hypothetical protein
MTASIGLALGKPCGLAQRADRPLERVVEIGVLPDRAFPDIGEGRGAVELFALIADIGNDVVRGRLEDGLGLQFLKPRADLVELLAVGGRCGTGRGAGFARLGLGRSQ